MLGTACRTRFVSCKRFAFTNEDDITIRFFLAAERKDIGLVNTQPPIARSYPPDAICYDGLVLFERHVSVILGRMTILLQDGVFMTLLSSRLVQKEPERERIITAYCLTFKLNKLPTRNITKLNRICRPFLTLGRPFCTKARPAQLYRSVIEQN
ncbi:hypothetical protein B0T17DRAFT_602254 [Bombardia bombarda]|uniref:Uncharacterized protein n=1 Tax=Bombardia bombarda TaxID=252184 RepID=A0AA39WGW5_9PEZI|nr:hypothetical protein B0T17DRAFT_602254 [Bombardia bombarda]